MTRMEQCCLLSTVLHVRGPLTEAPTLRSRCQGTATQLQGGWPWSSKQTLEPEVRMKPGEGRVYLVLRPSCCGKCTEGKPEEVWIWVKDEESQVELASMVKVQMVSSSK